VALNPKQAAFVREYLVDLNATQAAIRVGYSPKTAKQQGSRLLTNADIAKAIEAGKADVAQDAHATKEQILQELARIGFSDPGQILNEDGVCRTLNEMPEDIRRCISSVKFSGDGGTEVKFWPKNQALELLGKYRSMWVERLEHTGKDGEKLSVSININRGKK
jgi:phage terminase small subunit